jgi:hydroxypyruvate isomerase
MQRREFIRSGVGAGATTLTSLAATSGSARAQSSRLGGEGAAAGEINQSVCKWCFPNISLEDLAVQAKRIGIQSIELLGPNDFPTLKAHGLI